MDDSENASSRDFRELAQQSVESAWRRVLNLDTIPNDERFIELGGDSLDAVEICMLLEDALDRIRFTPDDLLLKNPTLSECAAWICDHGTEMVSHVISPTSELNVDVRLPSRGQTRLWGIEQSSRSDSSLSGSTTQPYAVSLSIEIEGMVDPGKLQSALNSIRARHEPLGSCFQIENDRLVVHAAKTNDQPLRMIQAPPSNRMDDALFIGDVVGQLESLPFDLANGDVMRAALVRFNAETSVLVLCVHHIAMDAWSVDVLLRDVAKEYDRVELPNGRIGPPPSARYTDFALAEQTFLASAEARRQLQWWHEVLSDHAPAEMPRTSRKLHSNDNFFSEQFVVGEPLTNQIQELAARSGCTSYMIMLALLQAISTRYLQSDDFVIATPMSCRNDAAMADLIGFFVNTVPIRCTLSRDTRFLELLRQTRDRVANAFRRRLIPFEQIIDGLPQHSAASRQQLTQLAFAYYEPFDETTSSSGVRFVRTKLHISSTRFPLEVHVWRESSSYRIQFHGDARRLEASLVQRWSTHYESALRYFAESPNAIVKQFPVLARGDVSRLCSRKSTPPNDLRVTRLEHQFALIAEKFPREIALLDAEGSISYRELDDLSNILAERLIEVDVGCETRVGIQVEDCAEFVIAALATLKAGGCYVPLDPSWPIARIEQIRREGGCSIVVSQRTINDDATTVLESRRVGFEQHSNKRNALFVTRLSTPPARMPPRE
ncbi:MAG: condensation domain-containing protein [Pirellulaceae bacterium]